MRSPFVKPRFGELLDPTHPLNQQLVGAWVLNEGMGNRIGDSTWYRNPGLATAAPVWTGAVDKVFKGWGPCLTFNGSSQFVQIPHQSYYDATNAFSVELVYLAAANVSSLVFGRGGFGTSTDWGIGQAGTHSILQLSGTGCLTAASGPGLNVFQQIVGTYDGAHIRIYAQGALSNTVAKTGFSYSGSNDFFLGKNPGVTFYNGKVALVRFWAGRALQLGDVEQLYAEPYEGWLPSTVGRLWFQFGVPGRTAQSVQTKANIRATTGRSVQAKANLRGVTPRTVQVRANITSRQQKTGQAKANIRLPLPPTGPVYQVTSWSVEDDLTSIARTFSVQFKGKPNLKPGDSLTIKGGYDNNNVTLVNGIVDEVVLDETSGSLVATAHGRDSGARELQSARTSFSFPFYPPNPTVTAHKVSEFAISAANLGGGAIDFPDYLLYNTYSALGAGRTALDVIAEMAQPWNQFASRQYHTRIRDRLVSVVAVNYQQPAGAGSPIQIPRSLIYRLQRAQTLYMDQPRLNEIRLIIIRGAAYTVPYAVSKTTSEYFRTVAMVEVQQGAAGQVTAPGDPVQTGANAAAYQTVITEVSSSQTTFGDKLLSSVEEIIVNGELTSRTTERNFYVEAGTINYGQGFVAADEPTLDIQSSSPSVDAVLLYVSVIHEGLVAIGGGVIFTQTEKSIRQLSYDAKGNIAVESNTTQEFDSTALAWKTTSMTVRTHTPTTSGSTRTQVADFNFNGTQFEWNSVLRQMVSGGRPDTTQRGSRTSVQTIQAQAPAAFLDGNGNPLDPGSGFFIWSYENPYMGQTTCQQVLGLAQAEQGLQETLPNWEHVEVEGPLLPIVYAGQSIQVEVTAGQMIDYVLDAVAHQFAANQATTRLTVRRITTDPL